MAEDRVALRNRIIGLLLRDARLKAEKTKRECAAALGVPTGVITAYEEGRRNISLPELEVLSYVLGMPVTRFWEHDAGSKKDKEEEELPPMEEVLALRHRIIGALLRQARTEANLSLKDLADVLGCSPAKINAYELGKRPIPFAELEILAQHLKRPMEYFLNDQEGTIGEWHREQEAWRRFRELPKEVQEFVTRPINIRYLEVAMKLSQMPVGGLRAIAEGLLDITY